MAEANISRQSLLEALARLELQRDALPESEPLALALQTAVAALRARLARSPSPSSTGSATDMSPLTVLVADLSGYTALSETMDAERVREALNAMWAALDAVLLAWGAVIDQHAGDSVVALFGRPLPRAHDAGRAAHAALALQMELDLFNRRARVLAAEDEAAPWAASWPGPALRVGIHSGPAYFVEAGPGGRLTAAGDAVRLARLLEELAPPGEVLISAEAHMLVQSGFVTCLFEPESDDPRFGTDGPPFLLVRERPELPPTVSEGEPRLIGRAVELDRLEVAFQQAADSWSLQVVTVAGDVGSGKARLLAEFEARLRLFRGETTILRSRGARPPLAGSHELLRGMMTRRFGIRPQHSRALAAEKVRRALQGNDINLPDEDVALLAAVATMGAEVAGAPASARVAATAHRLLAALSEQAPVLIVVEDLQDVDPASLALIESLVNAPDGLRALILTTLDTPGDAGAMVFQSALAWAEPSADPFAPQTRIDLAPLSPVESRLLATAILSPLSPLPMRLVDLVVAESGGNALYIAELTRFLIEAGIVRSGARWQVDMAAAEALRLPQNLAQMVRMRLDHLPEAERLVLTQASVMGDTFWDRGLSVLRPLGDGDPQDLLLDETLARLEAKELVHPVPSLAFGDALAYRFARPLLRDVAYEALYGPQRRAAHQQIAGWLLEERDSGHLGEWFLPGRMLSWHAAAGSAAETAR